jgi:hypothetical protein
VVKVLRAFQARFGDVAALAARASGERYLKIAEIAGDLRKVALKLD